MRFAALVERLPAGGWQAWVPALPEVRVTAATSAAAEELLVGALEAHVRARWAAGTMTTGPEIRALTIDVRRRAAPAQAVPDEAARRRTVARLDAVLDEGATLPRAILDAVFRYRRELAESTDDGADGGEGVAALPPNVVLFAPRER